MNLQKPSTFDLWYGTSGPRNARVVFVAEAWGATEAFEKKPLVGASGAEFNLMLSESGLSRDEVFVTNCFAFQPPSNDPTYFFEPRDSGASKWKGLQLTLWAKSEIVRLHHQISTLSPSLVVACGNYALWALTGESFVSISSAPPDSLVKSLVPSGITSWRGSMLLGTEPELPQGLKVLPILHPAAILRAWYQRAVTVHDLSSRVPLALSGDWRPSPPPNVYATPSINDAERILTSWCERAGTEGMFRLSHDIETARGVITCMAFADGPYKSGSTALVIPFVRPGRDGAFENYWSFEDEARLTPLLRRTLLLCAIEGQNYNYDTQWIEEFYGFTPNLDFDTMLAHHLLWPGTPKALDYISSLYNHYYWYWKEDNKEWDVKGNYEQHLRYNAEDALRTYECATSLRSQIKSQGFEALWKIEKEKNLMALEMMRRGIAIDRPKRTEMGFMLQLEKGRINGWLKSLIPQSTLGDLAPKSSKSEGWWASSKQQKDLFYDVFGLQVQKNKKTGNPSLDDASLEKLKKLHPELSRIWAALSAQRSISVYHNTFISAALEPNGRMKSSFNTAGTETFRWSSSTNAFWRGMNLQNVPKGEEKD